MRRRRDARPCAHCGSAPGVVPTLVRGRGVCTFCFGRWCTGQDTAPRALLLVIGGAHA